MRSYNVVFKHTVEKDLRALPTSMVRRVFEQVEALKDEPFPSKSIKLADAEKFYRIRIGDYRLVYKVDVKAKQVIVYYIRHRRDVYRTL